MENAALTAADFVRAPNTSPFTSWAIEIAFCAIPMAVGLAPVLVPVPVPVPVPPVPPVLVPPDPSSPRPVPPVPVPPVAVPPVAVPVAVPVALLSLPVGVTVLGVVHFVCVY